MRKNIFSVGIVGYGVVGQRRRFVVDRNPNLQTVAVCDVRFQKDGTMIDGADFGYTYDLLENCSLEETYSNKFDDGIQFFNNYKDLLDNSVLDILFVCVPNYLAPKVTISGLERGLHVFCEKPPGRTVEDIREVMEVEEKNPNTKLKYGFNHRYHGSIKQAKRIIDSEEYGEVINLRGVYGKSSIIPFSGGWRSENKYAGGGILLDQGIHMLDMIRYFAGDFGEIKSFVTNNYWRHDVEDNAFVIMRNEEGCIAALHSTATQWQHRFRLEITLTDALLELSGILSGSKSYGEEKLKIISRKDESLTGSQDEIVVSFLEDNSWKEEVDEFARIILENEEVINGNSVDALKLMEVIFKIYNADDSWTE